MSWLYRAAVAVPSTAEAGDLSRLGNGEKSPAKPEVHQDRTSGSERVNVSAGMDEGRGEKLYGAPDALSL